MSGLTGYLTSSGVDLSSIFLTNGGGSFNGAITTNGGIIGPSTSISYNSNMIGYTNTISGNISNITITSGATPTSLITNGFTLPIGVYFINAYVINSYTYSSTPTITYLKIYLSTSNVSSVNGFSITSLPTLTPLSINGSSFSGNVSTVLQNTIEQTYYLLESSQFTNIVMTTNATNSYVKYTRIA